MKWIYDDGGRSKYYQKENVNDCVCRSIAIVTGRDYKEIYDLINKYAEEYRQENPNDVSHPRIGVSKDLTYKILTDLGYKWIPKMYFGKGCLCHLRDGELPKKGKIIVSVSKHLTCVVDNVIHDIYDPSREGKRCVYGYYIKVKA